jgi:two-component system response regulator PrrA
VDARVVIVGRRDHRPVLWADDLADAGFSVTVLEAGPDALRMLDVLEPEAFLIDMDVAGPLSAVEVCRSLRLRTDGVVMLVAHRPSDLEECVALGVGADHYLSERRDTSVVLGNLSALIRRRRGGLLPTDVSRHDGRSGGQHAARQNGQRPATAPTFGTHRSIDGEIEIDVAERTMLVAGVPTELTRTEFDLIAVLMQNPRQVFAHEQLTHAVGLESNGSNHPLRVHLSRLRRKVADAGGGRIAHNVHGIGYRLRP